MDAYDKHACAVTVVKVAAAQGAEVPDDIYAYAGEKLTRMKPKMGQYHYLLGEAYAAIGRLTGAIASFREAGILAPEHPRAARRKKEMFEKVNERLQGPLLRPLIQKKPGEPPQNLEILRWK